MIQSTTTLGMPDEITPRAQTLAALKHILSTRPLALATDPITVDHDTFVHAEAELATIMKERGYSSIARRAEISQRNFLFYGVPVICEGE